MIMRIPSSLRRTAVPALLLLLPACQAFEPYEREGTWRPMDANGFNLAAMVANPDHLRRGVGTDRADGQLAAAAVQRLRSGTVKRLPTAGIARFGTGDSGSADAGGGSGGAVNAGR